MARVVLMASTDCFSCSAGEHRAGESVTGGARRREEPSEKEVDLIEGRSPRAYAVFRVTVASAVAQPTRRGRRRISRLFRAMTFPLRKASLDATTDTTTLFSIQCEFLLVFDNRGLYSSE